MTVSPWLCYLGASALVGAVSRLWVVYRRDRQARRAFDATLFDRSALDKALAGEPDDDRDVLAELRDTLGHLNRQTYAEEFWALDKQLCAYYERIPRSSRQTFARAILRLVASDDKWLSLVAARTGAKIGFAAIEPAVSRRIATARSVATGGAAEEKFIAELQSALEAFGRNKPTRQDD
jgi:hypothetical protein